MRANRSAGNLLGVVLTCGLLAALLGGSRGQPPAEGKPPPKPAANTPDEPLASTLSLDRSADFLDGTTLAWLRENQCASCHTGYPYLLARASLGGP